MFDFGIQTYMITRRNGVNLRCSVRMIYGITVVLHETGLVYRILN